MNIPNKTTVDLEFQTLLEQISSFAVTPLGKEEILSISPINEKDEIDYQLDLVSEYTSSFDNENKIPSHYFDEFLKEIKLLKIENSTIEVEGFRKISVTNYTVNRLIKFFKKFKRYYPVLFSMCGHIEFDEKPKKKISTVIDNYGNIPNNASEKLFSVRKEIGIVKSKWNHEIVNMLASEVVKHLEVSGIKLIEICEVPGSWELIAGAQKLISKCDLIIPLGVVIRGETTHYELISETVTQGLMDLMIKNDKPVIMGLLATENEEQALKRANPDQLNKGKEFAQSALEILALRNN